MKKFLFGVFAAVCTAFSLAAVNVNTASSAELEALPGIGPAKAKAIVEYRQKNGAFKPFAGWATGRLCLGVAMRAWNTGVIG